MLITSGEQIYVAELRVPTCFYPSEETRYSLRDPAGFQVSKGYYAIRPPDERSNLGGYAKLGLVIEFVSQGLREAEDHALKVGGMFGSVAAAFGGYPLESPYLRRIAHVGIHGDLKSQHEYSYGVKPYVLIQFDYEDGHQFDRYLQSISATDAKTRYQIQSAIHWFAICIGADDPAISFVAAWTGLECIGEIIHQKAHPNGPKASCKTCGNISGKNRKRKEAGIDHMFNSLIKGPWSTLLSDDARQALAKDFQGSLSSIGCWVPTTFDSSQLTRYRDDRPAELTLSKVRGACPECCDPRGFRGLCNFLAARRLRVLPKCPVLPEVQRRIQEVSISRPVGCRTAYRAST